MALTMLASMSTGAFATSFENVPYFSEEDVIILSPETKEEQARRISEYTTRKFRANVWTTVAREYGLDQYEDIMINIENINGASRVHVQVLKDGSVYVDRWMGLGSQYTFDVERGRDYSVRFLTQTDATVTYNIHTVS